MNDDLMRAAQIANQQAAGLSLMRVQVAASLYGQILGYWMHNAKVLEGMEGFDEVTAADAAVRAADAFMARIVQPPPR